ncbi:hypothetical protein BO79DRAFT_267520 [Aspergillus costaricaensis CBS 115574]|uniref:Uncharacterized protein n=1 Tax=Aspergillus costaricaensis CBS 115574 TaxID=1448317 RepID=A0ACD1IUH7_9EURO|nr:hypothetical protein BO79DRAFT_267520 [Aspergillus costaricaensis CBS 115574]RAK93406.1 hypothetical protein BO79DRAFT_267520 [Aspergillus costaricaensis CBS 115574]
MVSLTFESLPVELVEEVVSRLDLHDLCALRLTGRTVSSKSSNATFRNYFLSKKLEIAEAPLENFALVTKPGRFGLWIQHLTLYAITKDDDTGGISLASPRVIELLAQGFLNIRDNSPHGGPLSITLKIIGDGYMRDFAAPVFNVTLSALRGTGLPIRSLDAFAEGYSHNHGGFCSIPFSEITGAFSGAGAADLHSLAKTFQPCTKLCLSLAHHIHTIDSDSIRELHNDNEDEDFELPPSYEEARVNTQKLCDLVGLCPTLQELYLVWEYDDFEETAGVREELYFFSRLAESCQFPSLRQCTLHNIRMSEEALLTFFRQLTRLVYLRLEYVSVEGEFDDLFRLLSTSMPELNYLHLRGLYSSSGTLRFLNEHPENRLRHPTGRAPPGIIRRGSDARRLVVARAR